MGKVGSGWRASWEGKGQSGPRTVTEGVRAVGGCGEQRSGLGAWAQSRQRRAPRGPEAGWLCKARELWDPVVGGALNQGQGELGPD